MQTTPMNRGPMPLTTTTLPSSNTSRDAEIEGVMQRFGWDRWTAQQHVDGRRALVAWQQRQPLRLG